MAIGEEIKSAWTNHPYILLGGGGIIALYFLWPRKKEPASQGQGRDNYATQLAAQTALAQSQLASQTALGINSQNTNLASTTALSQATAAVGVAAEQRKAIESQSLALQSSNVANYNIVAAQSRAGSFDALSRTLVEFGRQGVNVQGIQSNNVNSLLTNLGTGGIVAAQGNLSTWLTQLLGGGELHTGKYTIAETAAQSASSSSSEARPGGSEYFINSGWGPTGPWWGLVPRAPTTASSKTSATASQSSIAKTTSVENVSYIQGANAYNPAMLAALWSKLLDSLSKADPQIQQVKVA